MDLLAQKTTSKDGLMAMFYSQRGFEFTSNELVTVFLTNHWGGGSIKKLRHYTAPDVNMLQTSRVNDAGKIGDLKYKIHIWRMPH